MSQIFKRVVDDALLFDYLSKICMFHNNNCYIFNLASYKKGMLNEHTVQFCNMIRENYHKAKQYYIDRKLTYSGICTIIRQICKSNSISYTTNILYDKSSYNIVYYIYPPITTNK